jgi:hypothetical protein
MIGGPLFMAVAFGIFGLWIILLALPGMRRRPPGCEGQICPKCNAQNEEGETCKTCGTTLPPLQ